MDFIIVEFSSVKCSAFEHADSRSVSFAILEVTFVEITIGHFNHALASSNTLADGALVILNCKGFHWL